MGEPVGLLRTSEAATSNILQRERPHPPHGATNPTGATATNRGRSRWRVHTPEGAAPRGDCTPGGGWHCRAMDIAAAIDQLGTNRAVALSLRWAQRAIDHSDPYAVDRTDWTDLSIQLGAAYDQVLAGDSERPAVPERDGATMQGKSEAYWAYRAADVLYRNWHRRELPGGLGAQVAALGEGVAILLGTDETALWGDVISLAGCPVDRAEVACGLAADWAGSLQGLLDAAGLLEAAGASA